MTSTPPNPPWIALRRAVGRHLSRETKFRIRLAMQDFSPRRLHDELTSDYLLVSYPKSGRTWLRFLIGRAICAHYDLPVDGALELEPLADRHPVIPRIGVTHAGSPDWKEPWSQHPSWLYASKSTVFLVRDPRDVVVSTYFQKSKRERVIDEPIEDFVFHTGGLRSIVGFYNNWLRRRGSDRFHLVRYEDLHADTAGELRRVFSFIRELSDVGDDAIDVAVNDGKFSSMRKMEERNAFSSGRLAPQDPSDKDSFKTRRGQVGGYTDYFHDALIREMDDYVREHLDPSLGYGR